MSEPQASLSDVLYWFSLEQPKPTAALIDEYRKRFPQYADDLTDFALDLALDSLRTEAPELDADDLAKPPSAAVMRSISHFQNARFQASKGRSEADEAALDDERASQINPFVSLNVTQMRQLAQRIDASLLLLTKLRDRLIRPETIPAPFKERVAACLGIPIDVLKRHLFAQSTFDVRGAFYKAADKPIPQAQETFMDAVRGSGLSPEQQERLLKL